LGFPFISTCFGFYGSEKGFQNLTISFAIYGEVGDEFGWAVSKAGDANYDTYDDFIICAKVVGICYVIYGRQDFPLRFNIQDMTTSDGFRIIGGTSSTINFGVAVDFVGDFNKDGWNDFVISSMLLNGQGAIYVIFGRPVEQLNEDIIIEKCLNSSSSLYLISTPMFSFAGLSVAGVGDINNDGFSDVAVGSIPFRGGYSTQKTYVIFGRRRISSMENNSLNANEMFVGEDGFTIIGGGFLVAGIGDVNSDEIDDLLMTSFYNWQSQGNAYLINFPRNVASPPTFMPSSRPSSHPSVSPSISPTFGITTYYPTNSPSKVTSSPSLTANESIKPTIFVPITAKPTLKTNSPSFKITKVPSLSPTTRKPTGKPSFLPTLCPTIYPSFKSTLSRRSAIPTKAPSLRPTNPIPSNATFVLNGSAFEGIACEKPGDYYGKNYRNQIFVLYSPGVYRIIARSPLKNDKNNNNNIQMKFMKVFDIFPTVNQYVFLEEFDPDTDVINLSKLSRILVLQDLSYSTNPLKLLLSTGSTSSSDFSSASSSFSSSSTLRSFLSTHSSSQRNNNTISSHNEQIITLPGLNDISSLTEKNFVFASILQDSQSENHETGINGSSYILFSFTGVTVGVAFILVFIKFVQVDIENDKDEKRDQNPEDETEEEQELPKQGKEERDEENQRVDAPQQQEQMTPRIIQEEDAADNDAIQIAQQVPEKSAQSSSSSFSSSYESEKRSTISSSSHSESTEDDDEGEVDPGSTLEEHVILPRIVIQEDTGDKSHETTQHPLPVTLTAVHQDSESSWSFSAESLSELSKNE
jgi:hypothetical protein